MDRIEGQTTSSAQQSAGASNLATMADFGQSVIPRIALARDHILAITAMLAVAKKRHEEVPEAALRNLEVVAQGLRDVQAQFKAEFLRQIGLQSGSGRNHLNAVPTEEGGKRTKTSQRVHPEAPGNLIASRDSGNAAAEGEGRK